MILFSVSSLLCLLAENPQRQLAPRKTRPDSEDNSPHFLIGWGYTHDCRADKNPYPHDQGYRNFEIQIGPLDRWRHKNIRPTIPNSHEN